MLPQLWALLAGLAASQAVCIAASQAVCITHCLPRCPGSVGKPRCPIRGVPGFQLFVPDCLPRDCFHSAGVCALCRTETAMAVLKLPVEEEGTVRMASECGWVRGSCLSWSAVGTHCWCSLGTQMPFPAGSCFLVSKAREKM